MIFQHPRVQVLPSAATSPAASTSPSPQPHARSPAEHVPPTDSKASPLLQPLADDAVDAGGDELLTISSVAVQWGAPPSVSPACAAAALQKPVADAVRPQPSPAPAALSSPATPLAPPGAAATAAPQDRAVRFSNTPFEVR